MNCLQASSSWRAQSQCHAYHLAYFAKTPMCVSLAYKRIAFSLSLSSLAPCSNINIISLGVHSRISPHKSCVSVSSKFGGKIYDDIQLKDSSSSSIRTLPPSLTLLSRSLSAASSAMDAPVANLTVPTDSEEGTRKADPIVLYVVLRKDLVDTMKWPLGSLISQGCHAAVAAIWLHKDDAITAEYCRSENLDHMHKVILEVKGETQLRNLAQKLETGGIAHKLWIEQPENIPTCLATKPYRKSEVASFFKNLKLCR